MLSSHRRLVRLSAVVVASSLLLSACGESESANSRIIQGLHQKKPREPITRAMSDLVSSEVAKGLGTDKYGLPTAHGAPLASGALEKCPDFKGDTFQAIADSQTLEDHEIEVDYGLDKADLSSWDGMCAPIKFEGKNVFATVATVPYESNGNDVTGPMLYIFDGNNGTPLVTQPFEMPQEFTGTKLSDFAVSEVGEELVFSQSDVAESEAPRIFALSLADATTKVLQQPKASGEQRRLEEFPLGETYVYLVQRTGEEGDQLLLIDALSGEEKVLVDANAPGFIDGELPQEAKGYTFLHNNDFVVGISDNAARPTFVYDEAHGARMLGDAFPTANPDDPAKVTSPTSTVVRNKLTLLDKDEGIRVIDLASGEMIKEVSNEDMTKIFETEDYKEEGISAISDGMSLYLATGQTQESTERYKVNLETLEVEEKQPKVVPLFDTQNLFYSGSTLFANFGESGGTIPATGIHAYFD
ncbi:TPA: hypothetical protein NJW53_000658 [Corynebacterium striatum]|nr:hypothetical protein [Corynebacterium striatum]